MSVSENAVIEKMVEDVVRLCDPCAVYLVSKKNNTKGELSGFKLCAVVPDGESPDSVESRLLLGTECPVPCDFIVYTLSDWDDCSNDDCSFAYRVENGGERLYVKG